MNKPIESSGVLCSQTSHVRRVYLWGDCCVRTFESIQPLLGDNQQLHVRMRTWSRQLGRSGNTTPLPLTRERKKKKKSSIIDFVIITVLWYMKLNQMMHKCAWRNQHVSMEGSSVGLVGTREGLRQKLFFAPSERSESIYVLQLMCILISGMVWHHCKWEGSSLKLMAGWRIK